MTHTNHPINYEVIAWLETPAALANGWYRHEMRALSLPMLAVKDTDDTGSPMEIAASDYDDSMRWWL